MYTYVNPAQDDESKFIQVLGRHFVILSFWVSKEGKGTESTFFNYSGCIVSIRNTWYFATAGHCIIEIQEIIDLDYKIFNCTLDDFYGDLAKHKEPIPVARLESFAMGSTYCEEKNSGLDVGLIELSNYYVNLLQANNIVPITEHQWDNIDKVDFFDLHILVGLPREGVEYSVENKKGSTSYKFEKTVFSVDVKKIDDPDKQKFFYPRFAGQIKNMAPLTDIKGMSGGLIFGFSKKMDRYYLVAIQSTWNSATLQIFGSYLQYLVYAILDYIDNHS